MGSQSSKGEVATEANAATAADAAAVKTNGQVITHLLYLTAKHTIEHFFYFLEKTTCEILLDVEMRSVENTEVSDESGGVEHRRLVLMMAIMRARERWETLVICDCVD